MWLLRNLNCYFFAFAPISSPYLQQRQTSYFAWANNSRDFIANSRQLPNCIRRCKMFSHSRCTFLRLDRALLLKRISTKRFAGSVQAGRQTSTFSLFSGICSRHGKHQCTSFPIWFIPFFFSSLARKMKMNRGREKLEVYDDDDCLHLRLASTHMATSLAV